MATGRPSARIAGPPKLVHECAPACGSVQASLREACGAQGRVCAGRAQKRRETRAQKARAGPPKLVRGAREHGSVPEACLGAVRCVRDAWDARGARAEAHVRPHTANIHGRGGKTRTRHGRRKLRGARAVAGACRRRVGALPDACGTRWNACGRARVPAGRVCQQGRSEHLSGRERRALSRPFHDLSRRPFHDLSRRPFCDPSPVLSDARVSKYVPREIARDRRKKKGDLSMTFLALVPTRTAPLSHPPTHSHAMGSAPRTACRATRCSTRAARAVPASLARRVRRRSCRT